MPAPPEPGRIALSEVRHLATLARIELDDAALTRLADELQVILTAVASVAEVAADDVPATSHPQPLTNVVRPDTVTPCLARSEALAGAPAVQDGRFRVPRILDEPA